MPSSRPSGMTAFTMVWLGQLISVLATQMSQFGLTIWVFEKTGSTLALGTMQVFFITPFLLISPLAGALVDRYDRKRMMMVSDLGAGLATIMILGLQALGILEVWHLYATAVVFGTGQAFQWPAYSAAISLMVQTKDLGRANGMMSLIEAGPGVLSPLLAGALLPLISLTGILVIDVVTFLLAIGMLALVIVPKPTESAEGKAARGNLWQEALFGFRYIFARPSLLGLQLVFFFSNLFAGIGGTAYVPFILSRTDNNSVIFGTVQMAGAIGGILGGVAMSAWGGFKRRVHGVLLGWILTSIFGVLFAVNVGGPGNLVVLTIWWCVTVAVWSLFGPLINGSNQAIWQAKVPPDLQGRVFSARRLIAWFTNPLTPLIAGFLADYLLEPAANTQAPWLQSLSPIIGTGPGSGLALLIILCSGAGIGIGLAGYLFPVVRNAEALMPDHLPETKPVS